MDTHVAAVEDPTAAFVSRWISATLHHFSRLSVERCYPAFFTGRTVERTLRILAAHHRRFVLQEGRSEDELATAVWALMQAGENLSVANLAARMGAAA